jgi:hypothetical protein
MTKKEIKKLALASYTKNKLDIKKINKIIRYFTKSDLKKYIKYIKLIEKTNNITVEISSLLEKEKIMRKIKKIYPNKNISVIENKEIIAGVRITDNDIIYEANLKNKLESLVAFMNY